MSRTVNRLLRMAKTEPDLAWAVCVAEMEDYLLNAGWGWPATGNSHYPRLDLWATLSHFLMDSTEISYLSWGGLVEHRSALEEFVDRFLASNSKYSDNVRRSHSKPAFTFIDLFAGIGGFHIALARHGGALRFSSEWDSAARLTYALNHGVIPFGDLREFTNSGSSPLPPTVISERIPNADIITAGFPCQPFSLAGVSSRNYHGLKHGLECETQGTLFQDIILTALATSPKALILENVRNLASHDRGRTLRIILDAIEQNGYTVFPRRPDLDPIPSSWAVQDSSTVSAQRRRRIYMVCIDTELVKTLGEFSFPVLSPSPGMPLTLREVIDLDNSRSRTSHQSKFAEFAISDRMWASHRKREREHQLRGNGFRIGLMSDRDTKTPTLVARYYKDGKDCLIPRSGDRFAERTNPRMLTPSECAILQTFPPSFRPHPSKTCAYKQFGNSITVEVAAQIAGALVRYLNLK